MSMKLREKTRENRVKLAKSRKPALWEARGRQEVTVRFGHVRGFDVLPESFQWKLGCSRLRRKIESYKARPSCYKSPLFILFVCVIWEHSTNGSGDQNQCVRALGLKPSPQV